MLLYAADKFIFLLFLFSSLTLPHLCIEKWRGLLMIPLREGNVDIKFIDTLIAMRCLNILLKLSSPSFVRNALMLFPYYIPVSSRISIEYGGS